MRIVIWNCNMAFHRKYEHLLALAPDIAIIPECADTSLPRAQIAAFRPSSSTWIGDNPKKGLGVFAFGAYSATRSLIYQNNFPYILPLRIDGPTQFNLLAVWACHARANSYEARQGPLMRAMRAYQVFLTDGSAVVAGDLNDNVLWVKPKRLNNHGTNVSALSALRLVSASHHNRNVTHGSEPEPTIYWRDRKLYGPRYHIDYCFVPDGWKNSISSVTVGRFDEWVGQGLSAPCPFLVDS